MASIKFLEHLNQKLKVGNRGSIHLNVLPGRFATRLDLGKLDRIEKTLPSDFLETLLEKSKFRFPIRFDNVNLNSLNENDQNELSFIAKKLNGIHYQNNDNYLEHGIKTFGFGYPILIKRDKKDPKKIIKAPLIIWHLDIEKSMRKTNEWIIVRDSDYSIALNEVLISHIEQDENIKLKKLPSEYFENGVLDKHQILQVCDNVLDLFNLREEDLTSDIAQCPNRDKVENITGNIPWISWSGIFGLFRAQKESIISDIDKLIENYDSLKFEKLKVETYQTSTIASVPTDPSQEEILNSLTKSPARIIQGPPGTGKSQSLTAIITNALASGAKCLVVCEKKTALDVIHNNLGDLSLDGLCAVIDDVSKDRKKIISRVRTIIDELNHHRSTFREHEYRTKYSEYQKLRNDINVKHQAVLTKVFGDDRWKDIIGKHLARERVESKELLRNYLDAVNYEYNFKEFQELSRIVREGKLLYKDVHTFNRPLEVLNADIFSGRYLNTTKLLIESNLKKQALKCIEQLKHLEDRIENYGKRFSNNSGFNRKLVSFLSIFSEIYKELKTQRNDTLNEYFMLNELHTELNYFPFSFKNPDNVTDFDEIKENLKSYKDELTHLLEDFVGFQEYFNWVSFFRSLHQNQQDLILALIEADAKDWDSALESWYYAGVLGKHESELGPFHQNNRLIEKLASLNQTLKEMQCEKILDYWVNKQSRSINKFDSTGNIKRLYNYRKNKKYQKRNSLRSIIHTDFDLFTDFFPVIMVNPLVSSSILPLKEGMFDVVIFDEASQLRLEDTYSSFIRGKYKIVSGDVHQMPPSNYFGKEIVLDINDNNDDSDDEIDMADKDSLLHFSEDSKFEKSYLDFHYRSRHPFLIDFSNAAFYNSRLTPMPARHSYKPIRFFQVNGLYENRTNPAEAEAVIDILFNHIHPGNNGEYPSVGIATFNMEQRNLILERIQDECFMNHKAESIKEKLSEKGMFVKNLENIQGDERDIIIISTTFGLNTQGKFRQQFAKISQYKSFDGYRLLNVIITRAKHKLYVCTSVPEEYFRNYREELDSRNGNVGNGVFYAYLAYAQSIEQNNNNVRENILQLLSDNCEEKAPLGQMRFVESPFEQEVLDYLTDFIDEKRIISQYKIGGFRLDFALISKWSNKPILAIECDGAQYHSTEEAYAHDMYRQKQIEKEFRLEFYRIWSTNWWIDPHKETRNLIEFIKEVDKKDEQQEKHRKSETIQTTSKIGDESVEINLKTVSPHPDSMSKDGLVNLDSTVTVKDVKKGNELRLRFTKIKEKQNLTSTIKVVHYQSPIALALINKMKGEKTKVGGLEVYYQIIAVVN